MLESLGFSPVTFVITLINITVLTFVFRAVLWKPVTKFMEERARRVQGVKDEAERLRAEADALAKKLEERLKNAGDEAGEIVRAAREEAMDSAKEIIGRGREEAEKYLAQAKARIQADYQAAIRRFQTEAASLVVQAAEKLVRQDIPGAEEQARALLADMDTFREAGGKAGV